MSDDQIDDLKQFIETTVDNSSASIKRELGASIALLREDMMAGFASIGDIFDITINPRLDDYEDRLFKLEQPLRP